MTRAVVGEHSVLVTGASGLIGRRVVAQLMAEPRGIASVVAVDLHEPHGAARLAGVEYCKGDVRDPGLAEVLRAHGVDVVVHLAAVVTPGPDSSRELEYSIDVLGTGNVVGCCLEAGVRHFVYTSSGAAYGYHADNPVPLQETDRLRGNPQFAYADHKRQVEEMLERQRREHPELLQLIFRPGVILGEDAANPITAMFDRPIVVGVRGAATPFVMIWDEDVARCIVKGIREQRTGIYNLAARGVIPLEAIARALGKPYVSLPAGVLKAALGMLKRLGRTQLGPEQVDFLRYRPVLANERLECEFGFTPGYTSRECFERYLRRRRSV